MGTGVGLTIKKYVTPKVSSGDLHCVRPYRAGVVSMGWV